VADKMRGSEGDVIGSCCMRSCFRAVLVFAEGFSQGGLEFEGEMPLLDFWQPPRAF